MKIKNESNKYINKNESDSDTSNSQNYFKRYASTLGSLINNEIKKSPEERSKDFKALILTLVIISILIFVFWKVPFLHNLIFP